MSMNSSTRTTCCCEQARREVLEKQFEQQPSTPRPSTACTTCPLAVQHIARPTPLSLPLIIERVGGKLSTESLLQANRTHEEGLGPDAEPEPRPAEHPLTAWKSRSAGEPLVLMPDRAVWWPAERRGHHLRHPLGKVRGLPSHGRADPRGGARRATRPARVGQSERTAARPGHPPGRPDPRQARRHPGTAQDRLGRGAAG